MILRTRYRRTCFPWRITLFASSKNDKNHSWQDLYTWNKQYDPIIWSAAIPSYASMLLDPLSALVDTIYVGRLGSIALGGVGISNMIFNYFIFLFFFLTVTTNASVASAVAQRNNQLISKSISHAIWVAICLGTLVSIIVMTFARHILYKVGVVPDMMPCAISYFRTRAVAAPIILVSIGLRDLKKSVYASIAANVINLCLDPIFMFQFKLGVTGAALATVLSQITSTGVLLYFLVQSNRLKWHDLCSWPSRVEIFNILRPGLSLSVKSIFDRTSFTLATSKGSSFGIKEAASMEIVRQVWIIVGISWWPLNITAQSIVASYFASQDMQHVKAVSIRLIQLGLMIGIFIAVLVATCSQILPCLFSKDWQVIHLSHQLLPIAAFLMPFSAVSNILDGILAALRDYDFTAKAILFASIACVSFLFIMLHIRVHIMSVWFAIGVLVLSRCIVLLLRYSFLILQKRDSPIHG
eukprot:jgi/Galph1/4312/GphlegSOOS_G2977.1